MHFFLQFIIQCYYLEFYSAVIQQETIRAAQRELPERVGSDRVERSKR